MSSKQLRKSEKINSALGNCIACKWLAAMFGATYHALNKTTILEIFRRVKLNFHFLLHCCKLNKRFKNISIDRTNNFKCWLCGRLGCYPEILGKLRFKGIGKNVSALAFPTQLGSMGVCKLLGRVQSWSPGSFSYPKVLKT